MDYPDSWSDPYQWAQSNQGWDSGQDFAPQWDVPEYNDAPPATSIQQYQDASMPDQAWQTAPESTVPQGADVYQPGEFPGYGEEMPSYLRNPGAHGELVPDLVAGLSDAESRAQAHNMMAGAQYMTTDEGPITTSQIRQQALERAGGDPSAASAWVEDLRRGEMENYPPYVEAQHALLTEANPLARIAEAVYTPAKLGAQTFPTLGINYDKYVAPALRGIGFNAPDLYHASPATWRELGYGTLPWGLANALMGESRPGHVR